MKKFKKGDWVTVTKLDVERYNKRGIDYSVFKKWVGGTFEITENSEGIMGNYYWVDLSADYGKGVFWENEVRKATKKEIIASKL